MPKGVYKRKIEDVIGNKYGNWEVVAELEKNKHGHRIVLCENVLNNNTKKEIDLGALRSGASYGVSNVFNVVTSNKSKDESRIYRIWRAMRQRCLNKNHKYYHNYGGRGIGIDWNNPLEFIRDMIESYDEHCLLFGEKQTTIDRIDSNKNYSISNCHWATYKEQRANRRK